MRQWLKSLALAAALSFTTAALADVLVAPHFVEMKAQRRSNWCWVAAVQNLLGQVDMEMTQADIVAEYTGGPVLNITAGAPQVTQFLVRLELPAEYRPASIGREELATILDHNQRVLAVTQPTPMLHAVILQSVAEDGKIVVSDTFTGRTRAIPYEELFSYWHWRESIVVFAAPPEG